MIDDDEDEAMNAYSDSDEDYRENIYAAGDPSNWLKDKMFISNNFKIACKKEVITALKYFLENIPVFMHRVRAKNEINKMTTQALHGFLRVDNGFVWFEYCFVCENFAVFVNSVLEK